MELNHRRPALRAGALPTELPGRIGALGWIRTSDFIGVAVRPFRPLRHECKWLGWLDSNQRMSASKADALPLGDTPIWCRERGSNPHALSDTRFLVLPVYQIPASLHCGTPDGIRTRISGLRGRLPDQLEDGSILWNPKWDSNPRPAA